MHTRAARGIRPRVARVAAHARTAGMVAGAAAASCCFSTATAAAAADPVVLTPPLSCRTSRLILPDDANPHGNCHGGTILQLIEQAGYIVATRHANTDAVVDVEAAAAAAPPRRPAGGPVVQARTYFLLAPTLSLSLVACSSVLAREKLIICSPYSCSTSNSSPPGTAGSPASPWSSRAPSAMTRPPPSLLCPPLPRQRPPCRPRRPSCSRP